MTGALKLYCRYKPEFGLTTIKTAVVPTDKGSDVQCVNKTRNCQQSCLNVDVTLITCYSCFYELTFIGRALW